MDEETSQPVARSPGRRGGCLIAALVLFLTAPLTAVASAAAHPISLGEWKSIIYATPNRKRDAFQKGVATPPPPPPLQQLQTSSEPAPAPEPMQVSAQSPRFWLPESVRRRRGKRRR